MDVSEEINGRMYGLYLSSDEDGLLQEAGGPRLGMIRGGEIVGQADKEKGYAKRFLAKEKLLRWLADQVPKGKLIGETVTHGKIEEKWGEILTDMRFGFGTNGVRPQADQEDEAKTQAMGDGGSNVLARLKKKQEEQEQEYYKAGFNAAQEYAEGKAGPKTLKRIAEYVNQPGNEYWWHVDFEGWKAPFGASDNFAFAANPLNSGVREWPGQFWEEALGDQSEMIEDADFFHGFGEGIADFWDKVQGEL